MADDFDDVNHQMEKLLRGLKIMKIKDVVEILKQEGTWVRWNRCTRDRILFGNENQEVKKIGVCWVATNKVIEKALEKGINFIISSISPRLKSRGHKYFINKFFFHALCVTMKKRWYTTEHVRVSRYSTQ